MSHSYLVIRGDHHPTTAKARTACPLSLVPLSLVPGPWSLVPWFPVPRDRSHNRPPRNRRILQLGSQEPGELVSLYADL
jgi:hypothetical protein